MLRQCRAKAKTLWVLLFSPVVAIIDGFLIICVILLKSPKPMFFHTWSRDLSECLGASALPFYIVLGFGFRGLLGAFRGEGTQPWFWIRELIKGRQLLGT